MQQTKHALSRLCKQFTSLTLAGLMALSTFTTSYGLGGSAQGNDTSGVHTGSGGDFSANITGDKYSGKIGVRLSLVNRSNPSEVISKGYDKNGNMVPQVLDLLYVTPEAWNYQTSGQYKSKLYPEYMYNSVKTQTLSSLASKPDQIIRQVYYPEICTWANSENNMFPWLYHEGGKYLSSGLDFVNWCQTDDNGNVVLGEGYTVYTINVYGEPVAMQINKDVDNSGISYTKIQGNIGTEGMYVTNADGQGLKTSIQSWLDEINLVDRNFESNKPIKPSDGTTLAELQVVAKVALDAIDRNSPYYDEAQRLYEEALTAYNDLVSKVPALGVRIPYSSTTESTRLALGIAVFGNIPGNTRAYFNSINAPSLSTDTNLTKGDAILKAHLHTVIERTIPDTSQPKKEDGSYPALKNEYGNPINYLATESTLTEGLPLDKATEDWALLIEPIMWLTIFRKGDDKAPAIHTKIYGTISNIADAFCIEPELQPYSEDARSTFNWKAFQPAWGALTVGEKGYDFKDSTGNILLHLEQPTGVGTETPFSILHRMNTTTPNAAGVPQRVGYGVNIYDKDGIYGDTSLIHSWDRENYPDGTPGPAPDATDETKYPQETEFGDQSKKFNIVKWYTVAYTDADGTEKEMVVDVHTRNDTPHKVVIENEYDEDSDYMWEVKKWATGKDAIAPADGDTSTTFEQYHKKNPSTSKKAGICPDILYLTPEDKDSIVYIKLTAQKKLPRTDPDLTIVKVKDSSDGTTAVEKFSGYLTDGKYNAAETGWEYLEDIQTPDEAKNVTTWADVPQTGTPGATPTITVNTNTKTLYIHYQEGTPPPAGKQPLVLHQNELTHSYTLKNLHTDGTLAYIQEKFKNMGSDALVVERHAI